MLITHRVQSQCVLWCDVVLASDVRLSSTVVGSGASIAIGMRLRILASFLDGGHLRGSGRRPQQAQRSFVRSLHMLRATLQMLWDTVFRESRRCLVLS